jgi:hypothetical protein
VYDRKLNEIPAQTTAYTPYVYGSRQPTYTVYDRKLNEIPAQTTAYTPYVYGSGRP